MENQPVTDSVRSLGEVLRANPLTKNVPSWQATGLRKPLAPDERLCPKCKGMRFLAYDVEAGHPLFSQVTPCPVCARDEQAEYLRRMCGLTGKALDLTFANARMMPHLAPAYKIARNLVGKPEWFLTLQGDSGVGKTHMLAAIVNEARAAGRTAVYTTTAELMDHLRAAYAPGALVTFDGLLDKLTTCTVLALDELDRWNPTAWAQTVFFELVDKRYRNGEKQLTCFATNADLETLPQHITSRLQARRCQMFRLTGPDMRRV
jgi:DNA replication protein DnaC